MRLETVRKPDMFLFSEEDDGPMITLGLPVQVVRDLTNFLYRHATPAQLECSSVLIDELRNQLDEWATEHED